MADISVKQSFRDRFSPLTNFDEFMKASTTEPRKSLRVNTLKASVEEIRERLSSWSLVPVPWCKEGFWYDSSSSGMSAGNSVEYALGKIYIQNASSMIPPVVLDPQPGDRVLDLCASPGSKATQLAMYMKNEGVLVANDTGEDRLTALGSNVQRVGATNCVVTQMRGEWFKDIVFDKILLDAPCSGSGTIAKSPRTLQSWNPGIVKRLSGLQKKLLLTCWDMLAQGGTLVYSTCSVDPVENEGVIDFLLRKKDDAMVEQISLPVKSSPAVEEFDGDTFSPEVKKCLRLWPQDNDTEGFFIAKLVKK